MLQFYKHFRYVLKQLEPKTKEKMKEILQDLKRDFNYHPHNPEADVAAAINFKLENPEFVSNMLLR